MTKKVEKKLTAAQRIEGLEYGLAEIGRINDAQTKNIETLEVMINGLKQTIGALARRINATIESGESGSVSNDMVNKILVEQNIQELKDKVKYLKDNNILEDVDKDSKVSERSFVIGRELDEDSNEINPRMQFAFASLNEEAKEKVLGTEVGGVIKDFSGDGLVLEITELYAIADEKPQQKDFEGSKEA